jgi:filamentous hemagglutinin
LPCDFSVSVAKKLGLDKVLADLNRKFDGIGNATNRVVRSADELLTNGRVPSVRNGEFSRWFDDLSPAELDNLWANDAVRTQIERRIRQPGGLHEWCMACRAPEFRRWGVSMDEIQRFRTRTDELTWTHPTTGVRGGHGADGSGQFHNELRDIIDTSTSLDQFNARVIILRDRWQIDPSLLPELPSLR